MKERLDGSPFLHVMPRVHDDLADCLSFIDSQPWGDSEARYCDIDKCIDDIIRWPTARPVGVRRPSLGLELRRRNAAQFSVIYTYLPPGPRFPAGCVSLRAIRHRRVRNVFHGVKEPEPVAYG